MIDKNGLIIKMKVKDHIPYISLDQANQRGNVKKIRSLMNILDDDCSTSEGESTLILDGESGDEMIENEEKTSNMSNIKSKRRSKRKRHAKVIEHEVAVGSDVEEDDIHEVQDNGGEEDEVRSHYEPSIAGEINEMD